MTNDENKRAKSPTYSQPADNRYDLLNNNENQYKPLPYTDNPYEARNFSIPEELRKLKQWGEARAIWNQEQNKYGKFPYQTNGHPAKSNDSQTWTYFWNVKNVKYLAFFFNTNYTGLDFDHVIHSGEVESWVLEDFVRPMASYCEVSVSGNGLHIIIKGSKPQGLISRVLLKDGHSIEIYDSGRFFLLTGNVYQDYREIKSVDQKSFFSEYLKTSDFSGAPVKIGDGIKDIESIVATVAPYWQTGTGNLHFLMLRLSGYVASCGGSEDEFQYIISELVKRTQNGQYRPQVVGHAFRNSHARLEYNMKAPQDQRQKVAGLGSLKEIMEVIAHNKR